MIEQQHKQMVADLVKPGVDILASLTPEQCHLLHMVGGVAGEAGELLDAFKKHVVYRKELDLENVIEELGDLEFYMEGIRQGLGITREQVLEANYAKLGRRYENRRYSDTHARERKDKQEAGEDDQPVIPQPVVHYAAAAREMRVQLPGVDPAYPVQVALDYYGRNPRAQLLVYAPAVDEPQVQIRLSEVGDVVEIFVGEDVPVYRDSDDETDWEKERDSNPPCKKGERLLMPSGLWAVVERLQDRYDSLEEFKAFNQSYGILARLSNQPGVSHRTSDYGSTDEAWDDNPLIASTTVPSDMSTVPERHDDD